MRNIKQNNFDDFVCIASACPESCCIGWQIVIDEDSLEKYRNMPGEIGKRLKTSIDWEESCYLQNGIRCAMLNDRNLCDLQLAAGESALCKTCSQFPRHMEEYEDVREYSLSLSCPEALRMLLAQKEPISFVEWDTDEYDDPEDYEDFDDLLYDKLLYFREVSYKIATDRSHSLKERMELLLSLAREMQELLEVGQIFEMDDLLDHYEDLEPLSECYDTAKSDFSILYELETLHADWNTSLDIMWNHYFKNKSEENWADYLTLEPQLEFAGEQMLVSLLYVYLCGAVYDDWIYSKMALCVYLVRWSFLSYQAQLSETNHTPDFELLQRSTWRLMREIEHSDPNLNALEEWFMKDWFED